jgi:inorganic pyrophosphatase
MIDQGEQDDKIIGVHADDPEYRDYTDISELPAHRLIEIKRQVLSKTRSQAFASAASVHRSVCL